jgi:hypothetical protein
VSGDVSGLYWARFPTRAGRLYRLDTRVYLQPVDRCRRSDPALGAIVGKNPGSARPREPGFTRHQQIRLANDRLLPTVRSLVTRAWRCAGCLPPDRGYVQILNLFYLVQADFAKARTELQSVRRTVVDPAAAKEYPWTMFVWGRLDPQLATLADSTVVRTERPFFVDRYSGNVVEGRPRGDDFARHTQGMRLEPVIDFLAGLTSQS